MPLYRIRSLDDPHIAAFRDLPGSHPTSDQPHYVVEGRVLVERLLVEGMIPSAVLLEDRLWDVLGPRLPESVQVCLASRALLCEIVGFRFHRGALALARRPANPPLSQLASRFGTAATVVVCQGILDPENLGSILRTSAALNVSAVLVGKPSADPFGRRVVRVSMGAVFSLPIRRGEDLLADLRELQQQHGFQLAATVLDETAEPLHQAVRSPRFALAFGTEGYGLADEVVQLCDRRITIPMRAGIDSLNVAVAAGIMLYQLRAPEAAPDSAAPD